MALRAGDFFPSLKQNGEQDPSQATAYYCQNHPEYSHADFVTSAIVPQFYERLAQIRS
jgi:hypothetical protein